MKNLLFYLVMLCCCRFIATGETISLGNDTLKLQWKKVGNGYVFHRMMTRWNDTVSDDNQGGGAVQTILFSETYPDETSVDTFYIENKFAYWKENIKPVMLNSCGERETFNLLRLVSRQPLVFAADGKFGTINTCWKIRGNEIFVSQVFEAAKSGYYSVSTPALFSLPKEEIHRAVVPGCLNADRVSNDFPRAYTYGHYIPHIPVIYQDKCVTTPTAILSGKNATVAIIPEPEYPRKPHNATGNTHHQWCVGYSTVNLQGKVSPTLYYPVLGREKSLMKPGDKLQFDYRYIVSDKKWFDVFKQVVYNIYGFKQTNIMQNRQALIDRVLKMYRYLTNTKTSRFRLSEFEGIVIGAHDYMGGVAGSDQDAMKNSDYGAMWMLGSLTKDIALLKNVLPYARNFKIKQEYSDNGPFKGAVKGQYYLWKSKSWVEEWGPHIEPMGVTYYAISDLGNILLFNPDDDEAKRNLRLAADYLLSVQKEDGRWNVGIDKHTMQVIYPDIEDLRPTFYGMLVAWQILKDDKYLDAAIKGADWFIKYAVNTGRFIGACGDARFIPDFVTAQSAQVLMEMYKASGKEKYKEAAIKAATFYTTSIYTFPNGQTEMQTEGNQTLPGWGFTQSGLCFEHGGPIGSAAPHGPILLSGFSGMFVRMFSVTGDSIFLDMARAAVNGRDGFVDPETSVASYYWEKFNQGPGPYPHHAWWQIGWIMDYLVSEAELRSGNNISFPRGFISTKAGGPSQSLGFAPGKIYGKEANLILSDRLLSVDNPLCEYLTAVSDHTLYIIAMNSSNQTITASISVNGQDPLSGRKWQKDRESISLKPYGIKIIMISV